VLHVCCNNGDESKRREESDYHKKTDEATRASSVHVNLFYYLDCDPVRDPRVCSELCSH